MAGVLAAGVLAGHACRALNDRFICPAIRVAVPTIHCSS
jgi:hypothetical protein